MGEYNSLIMNKQYKIFNIISVNKWNTFELHQKKRVFKNFFLEIETILTKKVIPLIPLYQRGDYEVDGVFISNLHNNFELLAHETDYQLSSVYNIYKRCYSADIQQFLTNLYNGLRELFNEEIVEQKDHHFLPEIIAFPFDIKSNNCRKHITEQNSTTPSPSNLEGNCYNITKNDSEKEESTLPVVIILDNLRSAFNVGSIIRTAESLNVEEVWFCGYTPTADHPKMINTAMGTQKKIKWAHFEHTQEAVLKAKENGYVVYALETVENAVSVFEHSFGLKTAIVLGNEALGISEDVLSVCDMCLALPIAGWKNSLNVATACAVVCFEVYRQSVLT